MKNQVTPSPPQPPPIVRKTAYGKVINQSEIDAWIKQNKKEHHE